MPPAVDAARGVLYAVCVNLGIPWLIDAPGFRVVSRPVIEQTESLASLSNLLVNRIRLASHPRSFKNGWSTSSINLEFDDSRLVKEALLTSYDEEIREQSMGDNQGRTG